MKRLERRPKLVSPASAGGVFKASQSALHGFEAIVRRVVEECDSSDAAMKKMSGIPGGLSFLAVSNFEKLKVLLNRLFTWKGEVTCMNRQ